MPLAGLELPTADVVDPAVLLRRGDFADAADTIEAVVAVGLPDAALTVADRTAILLVLDERPAGRLSRLRAVLLQEHVGRVRDGLVQRPGDRHD
jgi:hypothetical protein